jgi:uncharacterized protein (DUF58 family)
MNNDLSTLTSLKSESKRTPQISVTRRTVLIVTIVGLVSALPPFSIYFGLFCAAILLTLLILDGFAAIRTKTVVRLHKTSNVRSVPSELITRIFSGNILKIRQPIQPEIGELKGSAIQNRKKPDVLNLKLINYYRGNHLIKPLYFKATGPLGLVSINHKVFNLTKYAIYPDLPGARTYQEMRKRGKLRYETGRMKGKLGLGTEFETIRPYSPDDDFKQINWIATAKTKEPMSNVYRVEENKSVMCLLDCGRLMTSEVNGASRLDFALDALTYLAVVADDSGDRIGTMAFSDRILRTLPTHRNSADKIVQSLYDIQPELTQSDFELPISVASKQKRSLIVIFTDIFDRPSVEPLIEAITTFLKRHSFLVVSSLDTEISDIKVKSATKLEDAVRYFVSSSYMNEQREVIRELRYRKIHAVIAPPEKLARATADSYFSLRQTANF